jgi:hypothetical protein
VRSLRFPLKPGPALRRYALLLHLLAVLAVWACSLPLLARLVGLCLIAASYGYQTRRLSRLAGLLCYAEGRGWWRELDDGPVEALEINASSVVTPWVVFVHARGERAEYAWALVPEPSERENLRHLRVCLRVAGSARRPFSAQRDAPSPDTGGLS